MWWEGSTACRCRSRSSSGRHSPPHVRRWDRKHHKHFRKRRTIFVRSRQTRWNRHDGDTANMGVWCPGYAVLPPVYRLSTKGRAVSRDRFSMVSLRNRLVRHMLASAARLLLSEPFYGPALLTLFAFFSGIVAAKRRTSMATSRMATRAFA